MSSSYREVEQHSASACDYETTSTYVTKSAEDGSWEESPSPPPDADVAALPFEKAMQELESIVSRLERGDVALEESIQIYERGEALKRRCDALLRDAEARIDKIVVGPDGKAKGLEPLDPE